MRSGSCCRTGTKRMSGPLGFGSAAIISQRTNVLHCLFPCSEVATMKTYKRWHVCCTTRLNNGASVHRSLLSFFRRHSRCCDNRASECTRCRRAMVQSGIGNFRGGKWQPSFATPVRIAPLERPDFVRRGPSYEDIGLSPYTWSSLHDPTGFDHRWRRLYRVASCR